MQYRHPEDFMLGGQYQSLTILYIELHNISTNSLGRLCGVH